MLRSRRCPYVEYCPGDHSLTSFTSDAPSSRGSREPDLLEAEVRHPLDAGARVRTSVGGPRGRRQAGNRPIALGVASDPVSPFSPESLTTFGRSMKSLLEPRSRSPLSLGVWRSLVFPPEVSRLPAARANTRRLALTFSSSGCGAAWYFRRRSHDFRRQEPAPAGWRYPSLPRGVAQPGISAGSLTTSGGKSQHPPAGANLLFLGVWRSLVARSVRVGEVPSSNRGPPIEDARKSHDFLALAQEVARPQGGGSWGNHGFPPRRGG